MAEDRRPQQHTDTAATLTSSLSFFGWRLVCPLIRAPFPGSADNPGEEVDQGDSDHSPPSPVQAGSVSGFRPPTAQQVTPGVLRASPRRK